MKIRKISNEELIVFLNNDELERYDLDPEEDLSLQSGMLHKFLFSVMETVREHTGFDPYDGQVVVEATTMDSGISLHISKMGAGKIKRAAAGLTGRKISKKDFNNAKGIKVKRTGSSGRRMTELDKAVGRLYSALFEEVEEISKRQRREKQKRKDTYIFIFSTYTEMESALRYCSGPDVKNGELYRNGKRYAMILKDIRVSGRSHFTEFAESVSENMIAAHDIREGWKMIAEGDELVKMAQAIRDMD